MKRFFFFPLLLFVVLFLVWFAAFYSVLYITSITVLTILSSERMADLEDKIFKQNVPGRWSTHEGSSSQVRPTDRVNTDEFLDDEPDGDDDGGTLGAAAMAQEEDARTLAYARSLAAAEVPETVRRSILEQRERGKQTGVKGVLADYKAAQQLAAAQSEADALQRAAVLTRMVEGCKIQAEEVEDGDGAGIEQLVGEELDAALDGEDGYDDDGDDEFMREYRQARLREMQRAAQAPPPSFGRVLDVTAEGFLQQVDDEDPRVSVVVHLFESSVGACSRMNRVLEEVAHTHPKVKFLRLHASNNEIAVDRAALPVLTIYRAGETVAVHAGIATQDSLGPHFQKDDVEWLLDDALQ